MWAESVVNEEREMGDPKRPEKWPANKEIFPVREN